MNTTELIARVRRNAFIRDNHPDYTDQIILDELNDAMRSVYSEMVTIPRNGFWLKQQFASLYPPGTFGVIGSTEFRISQRSVVGSLETVEISTSGQNDWSQLTQIVDDHTYIYNGFPDHRLGRPVYYTITGDTVQVFPRPDVAYLVRYTYNLRPSRLVLPQPTDSYGSVNTIAVPSGNQYTQWTLFQIPLDMIGGDTFQTGTSFDMVYPNGNCEVYRVGLTAVTVLGVVMTVNLVTQAIGVTTPYFSTRIRFANQSEWPQLPEDFHRTLADIASVKIMLQLNMGSKASIIANSVSGDLARMRSLMSISRTKSQPKRIGLSMISAGTSGRKPTPRYP